jgi:hypothetical protein
MSDHCSKREKLKLLMFLHSDPHLLHEDIQELREAVPFSEQGTENLKLLVWWWRWRWQ